MRFVEASPAPQPACRLIDDNRVASGAGRTFASLTRRGREGARDGARRVPQQATTAIGP